MLSHQRAAHQIITDLFTPQTIMQSETHRKIISWYIRFDLFAGMMSGGKTVLGREWFSACTEFYKRQVRDKPNDFGAIFEDMFATSRLIATDIALLLAARNTGEKSEEEFTYPNRNGQTAAVAYNPGQKWYYWSGMKNEDRLLLKCFDSDETVGQWGRVPHTAFTDPRTPEGAVGRESIEVRALVFG